MDARSAFVNKMNGTYGGNMILETERLYLREMNQTDFNSLCNILQDEDTFRRNGRMAWERKIKRVSCQ